VSTWLVTGGAGYIGSHVALCLREHGHDVVVLDDLSTGLRHRAGDAPLVVGDIADRALVARTLREHGAEGVVHLAAAKVVEDSVHDPLGYYRRNVASTTELLAGMADAGVDRIVYSSSAAVYGDTGDEPVAEDAPTAPANPYGETKLIGEWLVRDQARAIGLRYVALRYFNVAGTSAPELAETKAANLIPLVLEAVRRGDAPLIFGDDYPTPDGTCVRDYVHVADLAAAHVEAVAATAEPGAAETFNVGNGVGHSVREVVDVAAEVSGVDLTPRFAARRPGDPASVVADTTRITSRTTWRPRHDLREMVRSAWESGPAAAGR
jgi:UDP-glucose 4-epimerase